MHAEQEQFTDQFTTTFTGGYSVQNQFGPLLDFKGANGTGVMVGGFFILDWLAGFKIDITATKTRTKANTFGLNVAVVGEPALLGGWDDASKSYSDKPVPGCRTRDPLAIVCVTSRVSADGMGKRIVAGMASLSIRLGTAAATLTHRLGSRTSNGRHSPNICMGIAGGYRPAHLGCFISSFHHKG